MKCEELIMARGSGVVNDKKLVALLTAGWRFGSASAVSKIFTVRLSLVVTHIEYTCKEQVEHVDS